MEPDLLRYRWLRALTEHDQEGIPLLHNPAHPGSMAKLVETEDSESRAALDFLGDWIAEPGGPVCCALLGSVGMGKTTTSKMFARQLLDKREKGDMTVPVSIYLDLRNVGGEKAANEPELTEILAIALRQAWHGGQTEQPLKPDDVIRLVRNEGAIVIFDGLDEVLVHLTEKAGQQFTRELLRILPPAFWPRNRGAGEPGKPGRIMLTCRTHYFRSLREQQSHLTLQDRDNVDDKDYAVFILRPLTGEQIESYFRQLFPDRDVQPILATIAAVHNLPELATRPYTLSLIARALPQLEQWQLEGRKVVGVDLYRHMVQSWLERDSNKNEFEIDHKEQIMAYVAAELWRTSGRTWTARQMDDWLARFLTRTPDVAMHYTRKELAVLKKDLRTATFLVGGSRRAFRFAHTSLQEYFLACYLLRALRERQPEDWDLPRPSRETFVFLGQMLIGETDTEALAGLSAMHATYRPRASESAFAYTLQARAEGYPAASPAGIDLRGADLHGWTIGGSAADGLLPLRGARLQGADLRGTVFRHVDVSEADFRGINGLRLEVLDGMARRARFDGAALPGAVFRDVALDGAVWDAAAPWRTLFSGRTSGMDAIGFQPPAAFLCLSGQAGSRLGRVTKSHRLALLGGHAGAVTACAFSPDATRILSASDDKTLRLWDAASGQAILTLKGHANAVIACAFSPDATRILSASGDNTLRLWDAASGQAIITLNGHADAVTACAFSPDATRILSASDDKTLRLWDAASGQAILTLNGHADWVAACAFSPDGTRILSASDDNTLRLWDAASGQAIITLKGHADTVFVCAFSPDGTRILSASRDNTLRLWDATTGEPIGFGIHMLGDGDHATLSPDGETILHASPGAWRYFGWRAQHEDGTWETYPAEWFGPLPA